MEVSAVRRRVQQAIAAGRERAKARRQRVDEAERAYQAFLRDAAIPLARQMASALKAEGFPFTVATPGGGLRLESEHGREDYIELRLDTSGDQPEVIGRISRTRGSRTLVEERPVAPDVPPEGLTEEHLLEFLLRALEPWLERR